MVRPVLGPAFKTFFMGARVCVAQLVVEPLMAAIAIVVVIMRQYGNNGRYRKQNRRRQQSFPHQHVVLLSSLVTFGDYSDLAMNDG
jgi:hypothetical protein